MSNKAPFETDLLKQLTHEYFVAENPQNEVEVQLTDLFEKACKEIKMNPGVLGLKFSFDQSDDPLRMYILMPDTIESDEYTREDLEAVAKAYVSIPMSMQRQLLDVDHDDDRYGLESVHLVIDKDLSSIKPVLINDSTMTHLLQKFIIDTTKGIEGLNIKLMEENENFKGKESFFNKSKVENVYNYTWKELEKDVKSHEGKFIENIKNAFQDYKNELNSLERNKIGRYQSYNEKSM